MHLPKPMTIAIILIIIGIVFLILVFFHPISDIALAIAGLGFILSGFIQLGQSRNSQQNKKQFEQLMDKLEKIEKELEKQGQDQPKGTGVAIADIIASGLKYYAEHVSGTKGEEEND